MKKLLCLLLALTVCLSLCACGNTTEKEAETEETPNEVTPEQTTAEEYKTIEFEEPVVVWEDENIRVELICFFEEPFYWTPGDPVIEKGATFRLINKSDVEVIVRLLEAYVGMDAVQLVQSAGGDTPAPQKAMTVNYIFQKFVGSNTAPLESLEDLYQLDGYFYVALKEKPGENVITQTYEVQFSLPELIG